ncbi:hypothetical protein QCA50_020649 [Cerrena zonata]|uniref:non-specific serine/threonine protein kinase n=1 Tax=Cerrena zonata TaxID=2478898 RepID=A0AAW0F952_9APHY
MDRPLDEEQLSNYKPEIYYPIKIGDIVHEKYEVSLKLGFGGSSTVWLIRNQHVTEKRYFVLKVCVNTRPRTEQTSKEIEILRHIGSVNPNHPGYKFVRMLQDAFEIRGPAGTHQCLLFTPLTETLAIFRYRYDEECIPGLLVGQLMKQCISALSYLHDECHVIHTGMNYMNDFCGANLTHRLLDIKLDNILIGIQDISTLDELVEEERQTPSPRKIYPDRIIYKTRICTTFTDLTMHTELSDFDGAVRVTAGQEFFNFPIQPLHYRAPEVILGAPWTYSADIWNMGVLLWDMIEGHALFRGEDPTLDNVYTYNMHLAEMTELMGPPPSELLQRGSRTSQMYDADGKLDTPPPPKRRWGDTFQKADPEAHESLLTFTSLMLQWLPERRLTATQILQHPLMVMFD